MTKPQLETLPSFYTRYVENVKELDMLDALSSASAKVLKIVRAIPESKGQFRYEQGKWSIKEVLNHMMDVERIMAYRALRFARNDKTDLPGFEENDYAPEANAHSRTVAQLADQMARLRTTTIDLFASFSDKMLKREGTANKNKLSVINLGYIIPGHELHHLRVLEERYLKS
jgi:uncharacterized damage-inducible protein DinB